MLHTEIVDATYKEHPRLQGLALPGQGSRPSRQAAQASAKGPVQPFDEGSVDVAFALRQFDHIRDGLFRPLIDMTCHAHNSIVLISLDHLRDQNVGPGDQATSRVFPFWALSLGRPSRSPSDNSPGHQRRKERGRSRAEAQRLTRQIRHSINWLSRERLISPREPQACMNHHRGGPSR